MLLPLSRAGKGPGMIVLLPETMNHALHVNLENGIPSPHYKWAEESYTVIQIEESALKKNAEQAIKQAVATLSSCDSCEPKDKIGIVGKCKKCKLTVHSLTENSLQCGLLESGRGSC